MPCLSGNGCARPRPSQKLQKQLLIPASTGSKKLPCSMPSGLPAAAAVAAHLRAQECWLLAHQPQLVEEMLLILLPRGAVVQSGPLRTACAPRGGRCGRLRGRSLARWPPKSYVQLAETKARQRQQPRVNQLEQPFEYMWFVRGPLRCAGQGSTGMTLRRRKRLFHASRTHPRHSWQVFRIRRSRRGGRQQQRHRPALSGTADPGKAWPRPRL
mmetsp:Transcript_73356/g.160634  ORF Transcript_73356/g.160634 Transcript_73356/m.160634 type:complete len:213 (+) Transcript_73356:2591-3229(+)